MLYIFNSISWGMWYLMSLRIYIIGTKVNETKRNSINEIYLGPNRTPYPNLVPALSPTREPVPAPTRDPFRDPWSCDLCWIPDPSNPAPVRAPSPFPCYRGLAPDFPRDLRRTCPSWDPAHRQTPRHLLLITPCPPPRVGNRGRESQKENRLVLFGTVMGI